MARFRGTARGSGDREASRLGSVQSGLVTRANGWKSGIEVVGRVGTDGSDEFYVYLTDGSAGGGLADLLGTLMTEDTDELRWCPVHDAEGLHS